MFATLLLALMQDPASAPPPPEPSEAVQTGVVTNPHWLRRPSGNDMSKLYPDRAERLGYAGQATLSCKVLETGLLSECSTSREEPLGMGFGEAVLKAAGKFSMRPATLDGKPVAGGIVRIPVRFIFPGYRLTPLVAAHPKLPTGHADLNCRISNTLLLDNCFLESLTPNDPVLRETAMKLAVRFKMPEGSKAAVRVVLPIDFNPPTTTKP